MEIGYCVTVGDSREVGDGGEGFAVGGGDGQVDIEESFAPGFDFYVGSDQHAIIGVVVQLAEVNIAQAGGGAAFEPDVFPDANGGEVRAPVPAPMTGGFAEMRAARNGTALPDERELRLFAGDEADRRAEVEVQNIAGRFEQIFDFPFPPAEHVVRVAEQFAVEGDIGEGVEALTDEEDFLFGEQSRVGIEGGLVFPIGFGDPLHGFFVVGDEGVGDFAEGEEVGVNAAGDGRGEPVGGGVLAEVPGGGGEGEVVHEEIG